MASAIQAERSPTRPGRRSTRAFLRELIVSDVLALDRQKEEVIHVRLFAKLVAGTELW
jgi:hypothetical protein